MAENRSVMPGGSVPAGKLPPSTTTASAAVATELRKLDTTPNGLSAAEATSRLAQYGRNAIEAHTESKWHKLATYFWGPLPWMIEAAALISLLRRDWSDFAVVGGLLIYNAAVGFWQDYKASDALAALKKGLAPKARVRRDGTWLSIDAAELVPGDVVNVSAGQIVPADLLLIDGEYLSLDQAALTGESLAVSKKVGDVAYSGAIAKQGDMTGVVTATGNNTFFGRTAKLVAAAGSASHSQKAVLQIGDFLILVAIALAHRAGRRRGLPARRRGRLLGLERHRLDRAVRPDPAGRIHPGGAPGRDVGHDGDRRLRAVAPEGDLVAPFGDRRTGRRRRACAATRPAR